ncbi:MAG TPA: S8 family serine peptidase [Gemmatimonadales bacterium]|nr:S8 family serine peptidase [Gemmatimonadales bacterium]
MAEARIMPGVRYATVFYRPRSDAPAERRQLIAGAGAVHQSRLHGDLPAAMTIPIERLNDLKAFAWMQIVEVDSGPMSFPAGQPASLVEARAASMTQTVPWGLLNIGADVVHSSLGNRGAGIKIAVLDQGAQPNHPDLNVAGCYDTFTASSNCVLDGRHGTRVAGVATALDNTYGSLGIAPGASLYSVRVCVPGSCPESAVYDGLLWAAANGMKVVNISLGSCGGSVALWTQAVLNGLAGGGILVVAAAGNGVYTDPTPCSPWDDVSKFASADNTIAVAAYGTNLLPKPGYQYGSAIDFAAPTDVIVPDSGSTYNSIGGTSGATPHVAGALALMLAADFPPSVIYARLVETAFQPGTPPRNDFYGWGPIRVGTAIVAKPRADYITWCTGTAITTPGNCSITAATANGIAPIQVKFEVSRSDQPGTTLYGWGSASRIIPIGAGDYTLTIKATPREQTYLRVGYHTIQEIPVCTGDDLHTQPGGSTNLVPGGCGGGEEQ